MIPWARIAAGVVAVVGGALLVVGLVVGGVTAGSGMDVDLQAKDVEARPDPSAEPTLEVLGYQEGEGTLTTGEALLLAEKRQQELIDGLAAFLTSDVEQDRRDAIAAALSEARAEMVELRPRFLAHLDGLAAAERDALIAEDALLRSIACDDVWHRLDIRGADIHKMRSSSVPESIIEQTVVGPGLVTRAEVTRCGLGRPDSGSEAALTP